VPDVAVEEFVLSAPADVQRSVVYGATGKDEQSNEHRAETWTEALIVVSSSAPLREAIAEEVIVALAFGATKDVGNQREALEAGSGSLAEFGDLAG
jgi:hypothetical protein